MRRMCRRCAPPARTALRSVGVAVVVAGAGAVLCASAAAGTPRANGRIVYEDGMSRPTTIRVVSPDGSGDGLLVPPGDGDRQPVWSPDGTRVVFTRALAGQDDLWLYNSAPGRPLVRLTSDPAADVDPSWSPDGRRVVFSSRRAGNAQLYVVDVSTLAVQRLTFDAANDTQPTWSADDDLAFVSDRRGKADIYVTDPIPGAAVRQLTADALPDSEPSWSPTASLLAFARGPEGGTRLYTVDAGGGSAQRLTSGADVERSPAWAPDGTAMTYVRRRAVDQLVVATLDDRRLARFPKVIATGALNADWGALPAQTSPVRPVATPGRTVVVSRSGGDVNAVPGADSVTTQRVASPIDAVTQLPVGADQTAAVDATTGVAVVTGATTFGAASKPVARLVGARAEITQPTPSARLQVRLIATPRGCSAGAASVPAQRRRRGRIPRAVVRGRAKVRGRFSNGAAEGTRWTTAETCAGTVTVVRAGTVTVTDRNGRRVRVRAGGCHVAARRRPSDTRRRRACASVRALSAPAGGSGG